MKLTQGAGREPGIRRVRPGPIKSYTYLCLKTKIYRICYRFLPSSTHFLSSFYQPFFFFFFFFLVFLFFAEKSYLFLQLQLHGYNSQLYRNFSEAATRAQGLVAISLLVQVRKYASKVTLIWLHWAGYNIFSEGEGAGRVSDLKNILTTSIFWLQNPPQTTITQGKIISLLKTFLV